jgi:hypothetical protein
MEYKTGIDIGVDADPLYELCIKHCEGCCCNPWWGIIRYSLNKPDGIARLGDFKAKVVGSIRERVERIKQNYVTNEDPPRALFNDPLTYNVVLEKITSASDGSGSISLNLLGMFAFKCLFFSDDKKCSIHPTVLGSDIRPSRCAELGNPNSAPGEKGYCRVVGMAIESGADPDAIAGAIENDKNISAKHMSDGFSTVQGAAESVVSQIREYARKNMPELMPTRFDEKPGRNDPCHCGSAVKYKKCHGR